MLELSMMNKIVDAMARIRAPERRGWVKHFDSRERPATFKKEPLT